MTTQKIVAEWHKHLYGDDVLVADEGDVDFEYFTKWLEKKLITLEGEAEARGFERGQLAEIEANAVSDIISVKQ